MKKKKENTIFENVLVEDFASDAKCISRIDDKVIFIEGPVAPGDTVDLRVMKSKKSFMEAGLLTFVQNQSIEQKLRANILELAGAVNGNTLIIRCN